MTERQSPPSKSGAGGRGQARLAAPWKSIQVHHVQILCHGLKAILFPGLQAETQRILALVQPCPAKPGLAFTLTSPYGNRMALGVEISRDQHLCHPSQLLWVSRPPKA